MPPPVVTPLPSISPSTAAQLRRCALRMAFSHSTEHRRLVARSASARLGEIAHDVIRLVGQGALDGAEPETWDQQIAALWDERVEREAQSVAASVGDAHLAHPSRWRRAEARFASTLLECRKLASARREMGLAAETSRQGLISAPGLVRGVAALLDSAAAPTPALFDDELAAYDGRLRGRPDHVGFENGEFVVEDYKSGSLFDASEEPDAEPVIRADYRLQLLLYAVLCREALGRWPATLILTPIGKDPVTIEMTPIVEAEAEAAAAEAIQLLDQYNALTGTDASALASPSPEGCQLCPYRGPCEPYWAAATDAWPPPERPTVGGRVTAISVLGNGGRLITLEAIMGTAGRGTQVVHCLQGEQLASESGPIQPGDAARLVNLFRHRGELTASANTEVWRGRSGGTMGVGP